MGNVTREILQNARERDALRRSLRDQAPYYPDYLHRSVYNDRWIEYFITTLLRHKHEGTWYAQHFIENKLVKRSEAKNIKGLEESIKEELVKRLMKQVYVSILFYEINPDFKIPEGQLIDPVDELQQSEKERLGL